MTGRALLFAAVGAATLGFATLAQATECNDGGPCGRLYEGREVYAPMYEGREVYVPAPFLSGLSQGPYDNSWVDPRTERDTPSAPR
jgi:hypothetical protein